MLQNFPIHNVGSLWLLENVLKLQHFGLQDLGSLQETKCRAATYDTQLSPSTQAINYYNLHLFK